VLVTGGLPPVGSDAWSESRSLLDEEKDTPGPLRRHVDWGQEVTGFRTLRESSGVHRRKNTKEGEVDGGAWLWARWGPGVVQSIGWTQLTWATLDEKFK